MRNFLKIAAGLIITFFCIAFIFIQIELTQFLATLAKLEWLYLSAGILSLLSGYVLRIWRWSYLLWVIGYGISVSRCSSPFLAAVALNNIMPFRMGDVIRVLVFPVSMGIKKRDAASSLIIERLVDLLLLLICLFISMLLIQITTLKYEEKQLFYALALICLLFFTLCIFLGEKISNFFTKIVEKSVLIGTHERLRGIFISFGSLFMILSKMSNPLALFITLLISVFIWIFEAGLFYFVLLSLNLEATLSLAAFTMALATLSTLLPSSPGYIGPFHLAAFSAITFIGGSAEQAGSYAVLIHAALWIPTTIVGLLAILAKPKLFKFSELKITILNPRVMKSEKDEI